MRLSSKQNSRVRFPVRADFSDAFSIFLWYNAFMNQFGRVNPEEIFYPQQRPSLVAPPSPAPAEGSFYPQPQPFLAVNPLDILQKCGSLFRIWRRLSIGNSIW